MTSRRPGKPQCIAGNGKIFRRRNDIEFSGRDRHPVDRFPNIQRGASREQVDHHAFMRGIEVLDQNPGGGKFRWNPGEHSRTGFKPTRRSADANNGKVGRQGRGFAIVPGARRDRPNGMLTVAGHARAFGLECVNNAYC